MIYPVILLPQTGDFEILLSPKEVYLFNAKRASNYKNGKEQLSRFRAYFPLILRSLAKDFSPYLPAYSIYKAEESCLLLSKPSFEAPAVVKIEKEEILLPIRLSKNWVQVSIYKNGKNYSGWVSRAFLKAIPSIALLYDEQGREITLNRSDLVIIAIKIADEFLKGKFKETLSMKAALSDFYDVSPRDPRTFAFAYQALAGLRILPNTFHEERFSPGKPVKRWEVIYTLTRLLDLTWYGEQGVTKIDLTRSAEELDNIFTKIKDVSYPREIHPGFIFLFSLLSYEPDPFLPESNAKPILTWPYADSPRGYFKGYWLESKLEPQKEATLPWTLALVGKLFTGKPLEYIKDNPLLYFGGTKSTRSSFKTLKEKYPGLIEEVPAPSVFFDSPDLNGTLTEAGPGWLKILTDDGKVKKLNLDRTSGVLYPSYIKQTEKTVSVKALVLNSTDSYSIVVPMEKFPVPSDSPIKIPAGNLTAGSKVTLSMKVIYTDIGCFKVEEAFSFFSSGRKMKFLKGPVKIWFKRNRSFRSREKIYLIELSPFSSWWGMNPPASRILKEVKLTGLVKE